MAPAFPETKKTLHPQEHTLGYQSLRPFQGRPLGWPPWCTSWKCLSSTGITKVLLQWEDCGLPNWQRKLRSMSCHAVNIYFLLTQVKSYLSFSPGLSLDGGAEKSKGRHGALCLKSQHERSWLVLGQPGLQKKIISQNKKEREKEKREREEERERQQEGRKGGKEGGKKEGGKQGHGGEQSV